MHVLQAQADGGDVMGWMDGNTIYITKEKCYAVHNLHRRRLEAAVRSEWPFIIIIIITHRDVWRGVVSRC